MVRGRGGRHRAGRDFRPGAGPGHLLQGDDDRRTALRLRFGAALRAYEASKELAVGTITRPGYGPNGETVVFDGPRAIELFNKKYGKTEAPPEEVVIADVKLPFDIKYRMPGLRLTFPKFEINWVNRMQIRYTYDDLDTANRAGQPGLVPHPPLPVQVGRLDLHAEPDLRAAGRLGRRGHRGHDRRLPGRQPPGRQPPVRLHRRVQVLHAQGRPVQGARSAARS